MTQPFTITREFAVTPEKIFEAFTKPELLARWLAPKGFTVNYKIADIRPGGGSHYSMTGPGGSPVMWGKVKYEKLERPTRLVYRQYFSDEAGGIGRHPMSPTWPLDMLTTITLKPRGENTELHLTWQVAEETPEVEKQTFLKAFEGMTQGWTGSFDGLDGFLSSGI
jgi:uncharacterized protein YndB with AHSA1/START domain